jgi:hypothetical protein
MNEYVDGIDDEVVELQEDLFDEDYVEENEVPTLQYSVSLLILAELRKLNEVKK